MKRELPKADESAVFLDAYAQAKSMSLAGVHRRFGEIDRKIDAALDPSPVLMAERLGYEVAALFKCDQLDAGELDDCAAPTMMM